MLHLAPFEFRYGAGSPVAGEFQNGTGLSNGGERIRLADAGGGTVRDFAYNDRHPWPEGADGAGHSLVLMAPFTLPDHSLAESWRHSALPGGNPGSGDAMAFSGDPDADDDGDGLSNFMNHALGGSAGEKGPVLLLEGNLLILTHGRNLAADGVRYLPERSSDLGGWEELVTTPMAETPIGDGTSIMRWEFPVDLERSFVRLRVLQP